jgi:hypothetical protein
MKSTRAARPWATWPAMVCVGVLGALLVVVGPAADPVFACDCRVPPDATAFEQSDAVFVGQLVDYQPPPTRAVMSSADPATWIFEVSEVYKGEVAAIQEVVSEVSGASCGLEIPREGEFLVFATEQGFQMAVRDGQYYAGLCGGTRSASAGALAVDALPSPPESAQETTSTTIGERDTEAAAESTRPAAGTRDDKDMSPAIVLVGVAFALAVVGAAILAWRRVGGVRS